MDKLDFENMTDFDVNVAIARMLKIDGHLFFPSDEEDLSDFDPTDRGPVWQTRADRVYGLFSPSNGNKFLPCNNVAHGAPLLFEEGMTMICLKNGDWLALTAFEAPKKPRYSHVDRNPLRAAMIALLKAEQ